MNTANLTQNQKEFMDSIRSGHAELLASNYRYPVLTCSIDTLRTARSLERRGLITIGTVGHFEYNVQLVVEAEAASAAGKKDKHQKPRANTEAEQDLLERVAQYFEAQKGKIKKITMVGPKTGVLDEVIADLRAMK